MKAPPALPNLNIQLAAMSINDPIILFVRLAHFTAALMVGVWLFAQPHLTTTSPLRDRSMGSCNRHTLPLPRFGASLPEHCVIEKAPNR
jgi:hypothetical protein